MKNINEIVKERILLLDGAMGTAIQSLGLEENDFRGDKFKNHPIELKGNNDLLSITQPHHIIKIHEDYLKVGADIIETNTFNSNSVSMKDYELEDFVYELNLESAKIAVRTAREYTKKTPEKPRFVAGSIGPSGKTLSMSPDVEDPGLRSITFDNMKEAYKPQIRGLIDGGVDLLLIETVFDTLNAKSILIGIDEVFKEKNIKLPIMLSVTIVDSSGRTLSGQTLEAFFHTVKNYELFSLGINCSLGAKEIYPYIKKLSELAPFNITLHPNAGLPNQFGEYDESPKIMGEYIDEILKHGLVNIVGGCCGTTSAHIKYISNLIRGYKPRIIPEHKPETVLCGLEVLRVNKSNNFVNIGERTNVFGSRKFASLIKEGKYDRAISIARKQITGGAQLLDINMDDPMINRKEAMIKFLNLIASEPEIAKFPIMLDSSDWEVIETGLKCVQGKSIINSLSLKEGEKIFIERANKAKLYGAAILVMAFDEEGQATTYERKIEICKRSYEILTKKVHFPPEDIIFDPNILTIATGMKEDYYYADNFIKAVKWIKKNLPYSKTSGGISNLSFAFRGNDYLREAIHSVFLFHAINSGLDMGIVNSTSIKVYDEFPKGLIDLIEKVLFNPTEDYIEKLIDFASKKETRNTKEDTEPEWRSEDVEKRIKYSLIHGNKDFVNKDAKEALDKYNDPLFIIESILMDGMKEVGSLFDSGKMFLPQVIKSARVMKKFVDFLVPDILKTSTDKETDNKKKVVVATVKGDVHDIGKNIISLILSCNQFTIIDLGVMVPLEKIISKAIDEKADLIALSGLITPSLEEMASVASEMERRGFNIPLLIGGAATSELHTAVRIAPLYSNTVVHIPDASKCVQIASKLTKGSEKKKYADELKNRYELIKNEYERKRESVIYLSLEEARKNKFKINWEMSEIKEPSFIGNKILTMDIETVTPYIDWNFFFKEWDIKGKYPNIFDDKGKGKEAKKLHNDALNLLEVIVNENLIELRGVIGFYPANSLNDDVIIYKDNDRKEIFKTMNFLRNQTKKDGKNKCLADYIAPVDTKLKDYIGFFALTAKIDYDKAKIYEEDDYEKLLLDTLSNRLVEAYSEYVHQKISKNYRGYENGDNLQEYFGIRPAPGYPTCPDHREKKKIFKILDAENISISLTENYSMLPLSSVCGYYFTNKEAKYFNTGKISKDQIKDYSNRRNESIKTSEKWLKTILNY